MFLMHELIGAEIAVQSGKGRPLNQRLAIAAACLTGSFLPDTFHVWQMLINWLDGIPAEAYMPTEILVLEGLIHRFFPWLAAFVIILLLRHAVPKLKASAWMLGLQCLTGNATFSHIAVDAISHGKGQGFYGSNYFAPLDITVAKAVGLFSYRDPSGSLHPQTTEIVLCLILGIILLTQLVKWAVLSVAQPNCPNEIPARNFAVK